MTQVARVETRRRHFELWIEVGVVLLVCVIPWLVDSLASTDRNGSEGYYQFQSYAVTSLFHSVGPIAVVLFIIWRSKEPFARFGLRPFRVLPDVFGAIGIWVVCRISWRLLWIGLWAMLSREHYRDLASQHMNHGYPPPSGTQDYIWLAAMCLAMGAVEELVVRAYLITRFEELIESTVVALLLSTALFACYHGYQGIDGIIGAALFGLIQGIAFCLFRRFAPLALAHALGDFTAILKFRPFGF
jgi:membrane protease YdiL (CAAX protease family)